MTDFYDEHSMEDGYFHKKNETIIDFINKYINSNKLNKDQIKNLNILDLGCHDGRVGDLIYKTFEVKVDGADISEKNLEKAKNLRKPILMDLDQNSDWKEIPQTEFYDIVIAGDIIEHLVYTDSFMQNVFRVTKPNGYLLLTTPNVASWGRRLLLLLGKNPFLEVSRVEKINDYDAPVVGHLRYFTYTTLHNILRYYGFKILKTLGTSITYLPGKYIYTQKFPQISRELIVYAQKNLSN